MREREREREREKERERKREREIYNIIFYTRNINSLKELSK